MAEYVKIKNGKVSEYISTNENVGPEWKEVDGSTFDGHIGMPESWIDWKKSRVKDESVLISEELVIDKRGVMIFNKQTGAPAKITALNFDIPEGFTDKPPTGPFDEWIESSNSWVENASAKKAALKREEIAKAQMFLDSTANEAAEAMESGEPLISSNPTLYSKRKAAREIIKNLSK